jgi:hypothetical protein
MICSISAKSDTGVSPGDGVFHGAVGVAEFERLAHVAEAQYAEQHARDIGVAAADAVDDLDIFVRRLMVESCRPSRCISSEPKVWRLGLIILRSVVATTDMP